MKYLIFLLLPLLACPAEYELFCDWNWDFKGTISTIDEMEERELPLPNHLSRKLKAQGDIAKCWEIDTYRPWLITWKEVKSFEDFKHWLGIGLKRKSAILPETKYWMFWNLGPKLSGYDFSKIPKEKMVLVMWEPPTIQPELYTAKTQENFGKIFTWDDDLVDNKRFFKIHYPALVPMAEDIPPFEEKKFCVMICRRLKSKHPKELYSMRRKAIEFYENRPEGEFDLFGFHWGRDQYKNWRGGLESNKIDKLKEYKFSICYENMRDIKGYITEKIFDCFAAGVIPVYWGASNVTDYIPADCFIDRRLFANEEELYRYMKAMSKEEHQNYLDRIARFLRSEKAKLFTAEQFVKDYLSKLTD